MAGRAGRILVLLFAVAAPRVTAQEVRAPLRMFDGLPAVQVSVNGARARWFLVDTGASVTTLSERLAGELGLKPAAAFDIETAAGTVKVAQGRIESLRVGGVELGDGAVVWQPLDRVGKQADGILGFDRLSRSNFLLDYRERVLALDPGARLAASLRGEHTPFLRSLGRPVIDTVVQLRNDPGRPRRLVIDSGATATVLIDRSPRIGTAHLQTLAGIAAAEPMPALVRVGDTTLAPDAALVVAARDGATREDQGLLPASLFAWLYFDVAREEMVWKRA